MQQDTGSRAVLGQKAGTGSMAEDEGRDRRDRVGLGAGAEGQLLEMPDLSAVLTWRRLHCFRQEKRLKSFKEMKCERLTANLEKTGKELGRERTRRPVFPHNIKLADANSAGENSTRLAEPTPPLLRVPAPWAPLGHCTNLAIVSAQALHPGRPHPSLSAPCRALSSCRASTHLPGGLLLMASVTWHHVATLIRFPRPLLLLPSSHLAPSPICTCHPVFPSAALNATGCPVSWVKVRVRVPAVCTLRPLPDGGSSC